jgi:uncharacterized integral membrane protein
MAIFFATVTLWLLGARVFNLPNIILLLLAGWGPLITLFVLDQHSLASVNYVQRNEKSLQKSKN